MIIGKHTNEDQASLQIKIPASFGVHLALYLLCTFAYMERNDTPTAVGTKGVPPFLWFIANILFCC